MSFIPSEYQRAIFNEYTSSSKNIIIQAVAGAGKTTTLLMLAEKVRRAPAVLCAFNAHIAKDISNKLASRGIRMEGRTIHSLGYSCVRDNMSVGQTNTKKYLDIAKRWIAGRRGYYSNPSIDWNGNLKDLLDFTRLTLTDPTDKKAMQQMIRDYDLEADERMIEAVPELLEEAASHEFIARHSIDFTDMLWLPIKLNLEPKKYKEMFVDECQDLNALQAAFISKSLADDGRVVLCGDPFQAIMAFGGADAKSFYNLKDKFDCVELPLTYCYRCGEKIVSEARKYVSHIEVPPESHLGDVSYIDEKDIISKVQPGDVILCRKTAPLIDLCLNMIALGVSARVRGRDMVSKLSAHIKKAGRGLENWSEQFYEAIQEYRDKEISALLRKDMEDKVESFNDTINCIVAVYDPHKHKCEQDLVDFLSALFSDEIGGVMLSTVHRSKGLEWPRVFIYKPSLLPLRWKNQSKMQAEQEVNLAYVGVTRAMHHLIFIREEK